MITKYFVGPFYDYMPIWYQFVGVKIVQTQLIQSMMHYANTIQAFAKPYVMRKLDSWSGDPYKTKKTTIK